MPQISVQYQEQLRCKAVRTQTGQPTQTVYTDVTADHGGKGDYLSPIELTAAALGTCVSSMIGVVAARNNIDLSGMEVGIDFEMASSTPRRIGSLSLAVRIPTGHTFDEDVRKKIEAAAASCPVKNSLHPDIQIHMQFVYGS